MSHLVKPVSFRAGKTQAWASNTFLRNNKSLINSDLLLANGIAKLNKGLLRRKRLYLVKGSVVGMRFSKISYNLIYAPKIKTKPREHSTGAFLRRSIYKPFNWETEAPYAESYVDRRKEKTARIRKRYRPKQLNKWLTRRMFRGAGKIFRTSRGAIKATRVSGRIARRSRTIARTRKARIINLRATNTLSRTFRHAVLLRCMPGQVRNNAGLDMLPATVSKTLAPVPRKSFLIRKAQLTPRDRWKLKRSKWKFDRIKNRRFNTRRLSAIVSRKLDRKIKIRVLNLFSYLVSKRAISFKTHQNHFWNFTYRRYRFHYKNYYDIANAFLAMGVLDHAEGFLLSILRRVLPIILKIKRFFKFLNAVIKNMPELEDKFSVLKIHIAGKLAGGTKRTKAHSIGYGVLPVQTIDVAASNNFLAYRHIYGAFGLRLVLCKNPTYKSLAMLR